MDADLSACWQVLKLQSNERLSMDFTGICPRVALRWQHIVKFAQYSCLMEAAIALRLLREAVI